MNLPQRSRPAHQPVFEVSGRSAIVFVTVCSAGRRPLFADEGVHRLTVDSWHAANSWLVGRYVLMPDHLHLFCAPASGSAASLAAWVRYWKSIASRRWPRPNDQPVWQTDFWDRQLRASESYEEKWDYVRQNPVRAGLVGRAESWPFAGELNQFRFRDAK